MWEVSDKAIGKGSQTTIEERFLEALKVAVPEGMRVIVVADRGFGRVSFLRKLGDLGFGYVVRVSGSAYGQKKPWLLVTNMEEAAGKIASWYDRRMEIEEMFRDFKNSENGLGLRAVSPKTNGRYDRLLLVMALAYYIFVLAGNLAERLGLYQRFMALF